MKHFKRFFILVLCVLPWVAGANVATTAGSNLTAWNGNSGSTNNNNWNTMLNSRSQTGSTAKADFGNCNSLILRCAQPKCAACTSMDLARPVVSGCVNSSKDCKKHGNDLIEFIAAQIVASAAEKAQAQQLAQQQAAAQAAAAQSSQQLAEMQQQMAQMQQQMQQQNAQQMAQMQAALDEQKALAAQAQAQAAAAATQQAEIAAQAAAQTASGITVAQQAAIDAGVSEDMLVRQQVSGEILSAIENAEANLTKLKETMDEIFKYANCDKRGNNCSGPKRVKIFKEKALQFFEPYDSIADEMYDALETALVLGVDVSDVIMMLSGACNKWGKYMCTASDGDKDENGNKKHVPKPYNNDCPVNGGKSTKNGMYSRGGHECHKSQIIPPQDDIRCTLIGMISDGNSEDTIERNWLSEEYDGDKFIRVGCASSALDSIAIFGNRKSKKNKVLDLDTLERIILQDAPEYSASNRYSSGSGSKEIAKLKYCALTPRGYTRLHNAVTQKRMPESNVCITEKKLNSDAMGGFIGFGTVDSTSACGVYINVINEKVCNDVNSTSKKCYGNYCGNLNDGFELKWQDDRCTVVSKNDNERSNDYWCWWESKGMFITRGIYNCLKDDICKMEEESCVAKDSNNTEHTKTCESRLQYITKESLPEQVVNGFYLYDVTKPVGKALLDQCDKKGGEEVAYFEEDADENIIMNYRYCKCGENRSLDLKTEQKCVDGEVVDEPSE
jgi:hypothetical protein